MKEPVALMEAIHPNDANLPPTEPGKQRAAGTAGGKFTFSSGSRPLVGYTIKRGMGHGGFGEVYYATSDGGKEVALKLIRRNLDVELRGVRHCLNLKHPNLLAIYDIRESEQADVWVIMEFMAGQSLGEVVAGNPNGLPPDQAMAWFHGIGAGVACLHDHGIVHRDLKPANIFCDEGLVKVGDYGLSKFIACSRRSGQTESVGTVHYMAPEVANGRYGKEIDIYAMGVILYELLTGRVPFEGESVGEVLMKHLTALPDVSMLAEPFRSVVTKALEKDPEKRYHSVGEMLAALPQPLRSSVHAIPSISAGAGVGAAAANAATEPYVMASPVAEGSSDEPIWRAVRQFARRLHDAWSESNLNTLTKIVLLTVGLFVFLATAHGLVPVGIVLLTLYGVYWIVRTIVLALSPPVPQPLAAPAPRPSPPPFSPRPYAAPSPAVPPKLHAQPARPASRWQRRRERAMQPLIVKPLRERVAELVGSLLGSALVALTMCLVMVILASYRSATPNAGQIAWLVLTSIAGTWTVLVPSKFWEGYRGDPMVRRFVLMVLGLGLGVVSFWAADWLKVALPYEPGHSTLHLFSLPANFYADGKPLSMAFIACFGTMFLLVRWWRQADPLRSTRMSLWSMIVCVLVAWLTANLWEFPPTWLMMVACAISVSVQLASRWLHPRERVPRQIVP